MRSLTFAVLPLLAVAAACAPSADRPDSTAVPPSPPPAPLAMATILSPAEGDTVGVDVKVTLGAQGVTIEKATGTRAEGIGHHHLFLDEAPTAADVAIPPASPTRVHLGTGATEHTFRGVAPGPHRIIAVVAYGDHVPMVGVKADTVNIVVKK